MMIRTQIIIWFLKIIIKFYDLYQFTPFLLLSYYYKLLIHMAAIFLALCTHDNIIKVKGLDDAEVATHEHAWCMSA